MQELQVSGTSVFCLWKIGVFRLVIRSWGRHVRIMFHESFELDLFESVEVKWQIITLRLGKKKRRGPFFCIGKEYINYPSMHQNAHMLKIFENFQYLHAIIWIDLIICLSAWLDRCSNVRLMIVGTFTTLSVLLNCSTQIAKTRPHFLRSKLLLPEKNSLVLCMNVLCAREERIRMIGICNLQYADAAQLHTTGCACQGIPSFWRCLYPLSW